MSEQKSSDTSDTSAELDSKTFRNLFLSPPAWPAPKTNILVIVNGHNSQARHREDRKVNEFNHYNRESTHVWYAVYGSGLQGYRADVIIVKDPPEGPEETWYIDHIVRNRLRPGGLMLD
jgi:hypothetical protein